MSTNVATDLEEVPIFDVDSIELDVGGIPGGDGTPRTERELLDLLHARYSSVAGNGMRFACAEHVRNKAGFDAYRTADFISMDLWPSSGLALHGHEVKTSRSDWLRELADPSKAEAFMRYMDRWWLVVPDTRIVRNDLPPGWGLLVARRGRLVVSRPAPALPAEQMPKTMLAALLRAVTLTAARSKSDESGEVSG